MLSTACQWSNIWISRRKSQIENKKHYRQFIVFSLSSLRSNTNSYRVSWRVLSPQIWHVPCSSSFFFSVSLRNSPTICSSADFIRLPRDCFSCSALLRSQMTTRLSIGAYFVSRWHVGLQHVRVAVSCKMKVQWGNRQNGKILSKRNDSFYRNTSNVHSDFILLGNILTTVSRTVVIESVRVCSIDSFMPASISASI